MRRPTSAPLLFALALALAACADTPTDTLSPNYDRHATPFSGSCELVIQPPTPISPGVIRQIDLGECIVSHLGKSSFISDKVINQVAGTQTTQGTYIAANGDLLYANGSGTNQLIGPGLVAFTAVVNFEGGTGRFANATGSATLVGQANFALGRSTFTTEGSIVY